MNATSEGAKRTSGRYRVARARCSISRPSFPRTKRVGHGGNGYRGDEPPFQEVRTDGDHEATERRQAEHQEGADGGAQEAHDLQAPAVGPAGPRPASCRSEAPGRCRWTRWRTGPGSSSTSRRRRKASGADPGWASGSRSGRCADRGEPWAAARLGGRSLRSRPVGLTTFLVEVGHRLGASLEGLEPPSRRRASPDASSAADRVPLRPARRPRAARPTPFRSRSFIVLPSASRRQYPRSRRVTRAVGLAVSSARCRGAT